MSNNPVANRATILFVNRHKEVAHCYRVDIDIISSAAHRVSLLGKSLRKMALVGGGQEMEVDDEKSMPPPSSMIPDRTTNKRTREEDDNDEMMLMFSESASHKAKKPRADASPVLLQHGGLNLNSHSRPSPETQSKDATRSSVKRGRDDAVADADDKPGKKQKQSGAEFDSHNGGHVISQQQQQALPQPSITNTPVPDSTANSQPHAVQQPSTTDVPVSRLSKKPGRSSFNVPAKAQPPFRPEHQLNPRAKEYRTRGGKMGGYKGKVNKLSAPALMFIPRSLSVVRGHQNKVASRGLLPM